MNKTKFKSSGDKIYILFKCSYIYMYMYLKEDYSCVKRGKNSSVLLLRETIAFEEFESAVMTEIYS